MNSTDQEIRRDYETSTTPLEAGSDRAFGLVFGVIFVVLALYPLTKGASVRFWSLGLAMVFLALAYACPRVLSPLNKFWTRFGRVLHRIVSPIALLLIFFGAVLPTGLVLRALGKDPLRLRFDPDAKTYWIERKPAGRPDQQMKKQF